jgi:hypothetical protein
MMMDNQSLPTEPPMPLPPQPTVSRMLSLLQLALGFIGIQFAWNTQIVLSLPVLEPLGAGPLLYSLVWGVGAFLGLLLQPIFHSTVGKQTGKQKSVILICTLLAAIGISYFPQAPTLLLAGTTLALLDVTLHTAQGSYRGLLPKLVPLEQRSATDSITNFSFVLAPILALSLLPLLQSFNLITTVTQQCQVAGFVLLVLVFVGLLAIKGKQPSPPPLTVSTSFNLIQVFSNYCKMGLSAFVKANGQVRKLCAMQFFVWSGVICLFIYTTPFVVHHIYKLPDMSQASYQKEQALYLLAKQIDDKVITAAHYNSLSTVVTAVSAKKRGLILPTIADVTALNTQLDDMLKPYFLDGISQALSTIKLLSRDKAFSEGLSETERILELKLALLEFPLYEKALDAQAESLSVDTEPALNAFTTLPLLETLDKQEFYADTNTEANNTAMIGLVAFNLVALLLTMPLVWFKKQWGEKCVLTLSLGCMALSFLAAPWVDTPLCFVWMMAGAGGAWATILTTPFALLNRYIAKEDDRATLAGVFHFFMCLPQFLVVLLVGQWIEQSFVQTELGVYHNWSLAFVFASVMVVMGLLVLQTVQIHQND